MRTSVLKRIAIVTACLTPLLSSCEVRADGDRAGTHETGKRGEPDSMRARFQSEFDSAYRTVSAPHKSKVMSQNVKVGDDYLMTCVPARIHQQNDTLSIAFGKVGIGRSYSLISIDEFNRLAVIAATAREAYIDDNTVQPNQIRSGGSVTTEPATTYGHMDSSGYPYPAFGSAGKYLILLVNDALAFGRRGITGSHDGGPRVIAGCVIDWPGLR